MAVVGSIINFQAPVSLGGQKITLQAYSSPGLPATFSGETTFVISGVPLKVGIAVDVVNQTLAIKVWPTVDLGFLAAQVYGKATISYSDDKFGSTELSVGTSYRIGVSKVDASESGGLGDAANAYANALTGGAYNAVQSAEEYIYNHEPADPDNPDDEVSKLPILKLFPQLLQFGNDAGQGVFYSSAADGGGRVLEVGYAGGGSSLEASSFQISSPVPLDTLLIAGTNSAISGATPGTVFAALASGASVTTGADSSVDTYGDYTTIINTGTGCTDNVYGAGDVLNTTGSTVTIDGPGESGSTVIINGANNQIAVGADDSLTVEGGGGNVITGVATGDELILTGTNGGFDTVFANNDQDVGTASNGGAPGIYLAANTVANITGVNNSISLGGGGDTANLYAPTGATSTGDVVANDAATDAVTLTGNLSASFTGTQGGTVVLSGTGNLAVASVENFIVAANAQGSIVGGANGITLNAGDTINLYAAPGIGSTANLITNDAAGDTANLEGNVSATFGGTTGGVIGVFGPDNIAASGETITFGAGQADTVGLIGGTGNTVTNDTASDVVNLANGAAAFIEGSGGNIGIFNTGGWGPGGVGRATRRMERARGAAAIACRRLSVAGSIGKHDRRSARARRSGSGLLTTVVTFGR